MKMIALVSDQRMQNVIPLLQVGAKYSELRLVMSKERRTGKPLQRFYQSARDITEVLSPSLKVVTSQTWLDPFNIAEVEAKIGELIKAIGKDNVCVNISGGTKPMAIGALQAAQALEVMCLYTNTEDSEIIWLAPDGSIQTDQIKVCDLDVALYMRAYGETISKSQSAKDLSDIHIVWAEVIATNHEVVYNKIVSTVMKAMKDAKWRFPVTCQVSPTRKQRAVLEELDRLNLWRWHQDKNEITIELKENGNFINGGWVEIYVAHRLQQSGFFNEVLLNVELDGIEGEIDVAAVSNGKLVLIECKSNVQKSEQLNKLDAFRRRLGGPFALAYYARASEAYRTQIEQQCEKLRLNGVIFGAQLRDIGQEIGKQMMLIT